jgi:hypothetical protein
VCVERHCHGSAQDDPCERTISEGKSAPNFPFSGRDIARRQFHSSSLHPVLIQFHSKLPQRDFAFTGLRACVAKRKHHERQRAGDQCSQGSRLQNVLNAFLSSSTRVRNRQKANQCWPFCVVVEALSSAWCDRRMVRPDRVTPQARLSSQCVRRQRPSTGYGRKTVGDATGRMHPAGRRILERLGAASAFAISDLLFGEEHNVIRLRFGPQAETRPLANQNGRSHSAPADRWRNADRHSSHRAAPLCSMAMVGRRRCRSP